MLLRRLLALLLGSSPFCRERLLVLWDPCRLDEHFAHSAFAAAVPKGIARPATLSHHVHIATGDEGNYSDGPLEEPVRDDSQRQRPGMSLSIKLLAQLSN